MYAILDVETTGGKYDEEGITEIAIYQHDGERITDQFSSLVNPQKEIQPFVQKLTGISAKMLQNAPKFHEIAKRIIEITDQCILVAHNAAFDYRILQTEFRRLGYKYNRKSLCTVALSQILLPDEPAYSLGKLVRNLGIPFADQHRAQGDAQVTVKLFELLLEKDLEKKILKAQISNAHPNKVAAKHFDLLDELPTESGIYYLYNANNELLYIGKSNNIKKRVLAHLTSKSKKGLLIQKQLTAVRFALTGAELIALLKEQNEIKINAPRLNKAMRYRSFPMGIRVVPGSPYSILSIEQVKREHQYLSVYKNAKQAKLDMEKWAIEFGICLQQTSLARGSGPCFQYGLKNCKGACIGVEKPADYEEKINTLIAYFSYPYSDFLVILKGRETGESAFIFIEDFLFKGYGYFELNHQIKSKKQLYSRLISMESNPDVEKLIRSFLTKKKYIKLVALEGAQAN